QPLERHLGERAGTTAQLKEPRLWADLLHHRRHALGHARREHRPQLGRGDEIALLAELGGSGAVVTQSRRVERELHESGERDRPVGGLDLFADEGFEARAVFERIGPVRGELEVGHVGILAGPRAGYRAPLYRRCRRPACPHAPLHWSPAPPGALAPPSRARCMAPASTSPCTTAALAAKP